MFHIDVANVSMHVLCCNRLFQMFYLFFLECCKCVYLNVAYVFKYMLQVFYLDVAYVLE
jgi:hypothetical protein